MKHIATAVLILAGTVTTAHAAERVFALGEFAGSSDSADFKTRSIGVGAGYYTSSDNYTVSGP